jgi:predicted PurR-regulated permease PerM
MSSPSPNWSDRLSNSRLVRYLLLFALGWAIVQVLAYFEHVIVIFSIAMILAFLLNYPVQWVQRFMPRGWAVGLVFLVALALFVGLAATLGISILSQGQQLLDKAPEFLNYMISWLGGLESWLRQRNFQLNLSAVEEQIKEQAWAGIGMSFTLFQQLLTSVFDMIIIAVVAFFMLLDGARLWRLFLQLFPKPLRGKLTTAVQRNFLGFFWGRLLLCLFYGASTFVVFLVLGVPYALVLAAIAAVFDLIPGIGATLGVSLVCLIILPQGIWLSVKVLVSCILLQQVEENLLMPRIMQGSVNINPVVMFFALLVGAKVAGLFGIFLSIPITGTLINLLEIDEMKGEPIPVTSEE